MVHCVNFVENKRQLWTLHSLAKEYGQRPSTIAGIDDSWAAYQFDVAAMIFGREVEGKLSKGETLSSALGVKLSARERARMGEFRSIREAKGKRK